MSLRIGSFLSSFSELVAGWHSRSPWSPLARVGAEGQPPVASFMIVVRSVASTRRLLHLT